MTAQIATRCFLAMLVAVASACAAGAYGGGGSDALVSTLQVEPFADSVRFSLQVTNAAARPVALEFASGQSHDFVVSRDGAEVWRWASDRMFTQAIRADTLAPAETRTYTATWQPPAGTRGEFVARGFLTARGHEAEQQARFRLP